MTAADSALQEKSQKVAGHVHDYLSNLLIDARTYTNLYEDPLLEPLEDIIERSNFKNWKTAIRDGLTETAYTLNQTGKNKAAKDKKYLELVSEAATLGVQVA